MIENLFLSSLVDWSRLQFAMTAMFHWLFVPLTLGLSFIVAIMETIYVRTGNEMWKDITHFWMKIFGINFAIGVATGIILEFEFGTNWSNYSWLVGDIFGAPLAIEGILAFFMESTFIAVMFFGWNKVSKRFHLISTWLTAVGANLSALWILVANAWMQYPAGMKFNPDTMRSEMADFWAVLFSPVAMNKFFHTVTSAFMLAGIVVIGICAWYLLKQHHVEFAKKSVVVAAWFALFGGAAVAFTGDGSAYQVAQKQPMKLAAMEGLFDGEKGAGFSIIGIVTSESSSDIAIPKLLSLLGYRDADAFVPGINDIIKGGYEYTDENGVTRKALSTAEKIDRGRMAQDALIKYKEAKKAGDEYAAKDALDVFNMNFKYFGYGHFKSPQEIIPNVPVNYYAFRVMIGFGSLLILLLIFVVFYSYKKTFDKKKLLQKLCIIAVPVVYIVSQCGWIVAELGRQPWTIQDLLSTKASVSDIEPGSVQLTFFIFFALFIILLIAELTIMFRQIKKGPKYM